MCEIACDSDMVIPRMFSTLIESINIIKACFIEEQMEVQQRHENMQTKLKAIIFYISKSFRITLQGREKGGE